jgi:hypothetical protein
MENANFFLTFFVPAAGSPALTPIHNSNIPDPYKDDYQQHFGRLIGASPATTGQNPRFFHDLSRLFDHLFLHCCGYISHDVH